MRIKVFLDVRIFNPNADSNCNVQAKSTAIVYKRLAYLFAVKGVESYIRVSAYQGVLFRLGSL